MNAGFYMMGPPVISLLAGISILIWPRLLSYIVAFYLILFGLVGPTPNRRGESRRWIGDLERRGGSEDPSWRRRTFPPFAGGSLDETECTRLVGGFALRQGTQGRPARVGRSQGTAETLNSWRRDRDRAKGARFRSTACPCDGQSARYKGRHSARTDE